MNILVELLNKVKKAAKEKVIDYGTARIKGSFFRRGVITS